MENSAYILQYHTPSLSGGNVDFIGCFSSEIFAIDAITNILQDILDRTFARKKTKTRLEKLFFEYVSDIIAGINNAKLTTVEAINKEIKKEHDMWKILNFTYFLLQEVQVNEIHCPFSHTIRIN